jgi:hypothetical protein
MKLLWKVSICQKDKGTHLLARDFGSVCHRGPLMLVGGNLDIVAVASVITVPK